MGQPIGPILKYCFNNMQCHWQIKIIEELALVSLADQTNNIKILLNVYHCPLALAADQFALPCLGPGWGLVMCHNSA
jgi:hypothetical protein